MWLHSVKDFVPIGWVYNDQDRSDRSAEEIAMWAELTENSEKIEKIGRTSVVLAAR